MPRPTEFLERMTVVRRGPDALEALYHRGRGAMPVVFAAGHPKLYGTMESAVLAELAWALSQRGHPTLRFNYRGVGASSGTSSVPPLLDRDTDGGIVDASMLDEPYEDLCAALEQQLETCGDRTCAVVGYSFGAALAARAGVLHDAVERVILVAPPVLHLPFDFVALAASGASVYLAAGDDDGIAPIDAVERAVGGHVAVHRVPGASHEFSRGLSPLGQYVAGAFPDGAVRPLYDD